ncbi:alkaline phosphatase family protein [Rhodococcus sp. NPDC058521]|uniref:alkaline phosphatase family protein n=1 Tax=Rhodococcus sp. NPDC058521 TaxID=3346536 RepID=UPI00365D82B6
MSGTAQTHDVYSQATLSTVMPSVLSALGVDGESNRLDLPATNRAVVLLVDGMGWNVLRKHGADAPFLAELGGRPIRAGFPTTTATSIASLATGLPSGTHGITGYQSYVRESRGVVNWLSWRRAGDRRDELERLVPEQIQPHATVFERAAGAEVTTTLVVPGKLAGTGLTRAVLRGGTFTGALTHGDLVAHTVAAARSADRTLTYCYVSELDTIGHVYGPGTAPWRAQLRLVDLLVRELVSALGPTVSLYVTADHGMVTVDDDHKIDADTVPDLTKGVRSLAGEPRCRHVHTRPGETDAVAARWKGVLGEDMWIGTRAEAVTAGLFGPRVTPEASARIGDVLAVSCGPTAAVRRKAESRLSALLGHHGGLTDDELLIPVLHT